MLASKSILFLLPAVTLANPLGGRAGVSTCQPGTQTIANRVCTVECGVDYPGGDYKAVKVTSFQACINACAADLICKDAQYHQANNYCYMKKDLNKPRAVADVDSVICACPKAVTTVTTTTSTVTPTSATTYDTSYVTETLATVTATELTTTTEITTTTFGETSTAYTTSTVTETSTQTTTSQLTCLTAAYVAADHPATVAQAQIAKRGTTTTASQCTIPPVVTSTVTQYTTLPQGTITITNTITNTYVPTTTTTSVITETSVVSTTTTETVTSAGSVTTTTTIVTATAQALKPGKLDFRVWTSPYSYASNPQQFNAAYFRNSAPRYPGTIDDVNFPVYQGDAVVLQGFFIVPQTGTYRFDSGYDSPVDEWDWLWLGENAYNWDDSTANYKASGYQYNPHTFFPASTTITLKAGDAIPMTLLTSNSAGPGTSQVSATFPDGKRRVSNLKGNWIPACNRAALFK